MSVHLVRLQHPSFGRELRGLLSSGLRSDRELAGLIASELDALTKSKRDGQPHRNEGRLKGNVLERIGYLQLYRAGHSIRVYFAVEDNTLWLLHLDTNKRRTDISDGTRELLKARIKECVPLDAR